MVLVITQAFPYITCLKSPCPWEVSKCSYHLVCEDLTLYRKTTTRRFPPEFLHRQPRLTWLRGHLTIWRQHHQGFCCHLLLLTDGLRAHAYWTCTWPSTAYTSMAPSASLGLLVLSVLLGQRQCRAPAPLLWSLLSSHGWWRQRAPTYRAFTDFTFSYFLIKQKLEEEETAYAKQASSSFLNEHRSGNRATYNAEMKEKKSSREGATRLCYIHWGTGSVLQPLSVPQPPRGRAQPSPLSMERRLADSDSPTEIRGQRRCLLFAPCSWRNRNAILGTQLPLVPLNWDPPPLRMCSSIFWLPVARQHADPGLAHGVQSNLKMLLYLDLISHMIALPTPTLCSQGNSSRLQEKREKGPIPQPPTPFLSSCKWKYHICFQLHHKWQSPTYCYLKINSECNIAVPRPASSLCLSDPLHVCYWHMQRKIVF